MALSFADFESMPFEQVRGRIDATQAARTQGAHPPGGDMRVWQGAGPLDTMRELQAALAAGPFRGGRGSAGGGAFEMDGATYEQLLRLDEQNVKRGVTPQEWARVVKERRATARDRDEVDPISQEKFTPGQAVAELPCGHLFDPAGLREWFRKDHVCPVCRHDVLEQKQMSPRRNVQRQQPQQRATGGYHAGNARAAALPATRSFRAHP
eukprot:TRINITY_DN11073_c0_g1_i1.p2 TRINITY_DN11073_c0_g1~~TRINITY_DN11073_c0_g1_i1.p2  ORF type:complete len:242 (+),score=87.44 TRINITY_DN11073_c0_g1_i1:100-726(+)